MCTHARTHARTHKSCKSDRAILTWCNLDNADSIITFKPYNSERKNEMKIYIIRVFWKALEVSFDDMRWKIGGFHLKNLKWSCSDLDYVTQSQTNDIILCLSKSQNFYVKHFSLKCTLQKKFEVVS